MTVTFDQATHSYVENGITLPSVTRVLKVLEDKQYPEGAARRGTAVHLACQFLDESDLDDASLPVEIRGYVDAYRKFLSDTGWTWTGVEVRMMHKTLRFAGTIDRTSPTAVVDLKSGQPEDTHPIQLAAYCAMLPQPMAMERYALYLNSDGTYSLKNFPRKDFPHDWAVFQSALNVFNWRRTHANGNGSVA